MRYVVHAENHKPRIIETTEPNYADRITDAVISALLVGDSVVVNRIRETVTPEPSDAYIGSVYHGDRNGVEL